MTMIYLALFILALACIMAAGVLLALDAPAFEFRKRVHIKSCCCGRDQYGAYFRDPLCDSATRLWEKRQRQALR